MSDTAHQRTPRSGATSGEVRDGQQVPHTKVRLAQGPGELPSLQFPSWWLWEGTYHSGGSNPKPSCPGQRQELPSPLLILFLPPPSVPAITSSTASTAIFPELRLSPTLAAWINHTQNPARASCPWEMSRARGGGSMQPFLPWAGEKGFSQAAFREQKHKDIRMGDLWRSTRHLSSFEL